MDIVEAERSNQVTRLLADVRSGNDSAVRRLLPLVYAELRAIAGDMFRHQPPDHTLEATALVHEAFVRLVRDPQAEFADRTHFFAVAAKAMRNLLIDHARKKRTTKRGSGWQRLTLSEVSEVLPTQSPDILALDRALAELAALHERQARVVELRFFGGLTIPETADFLGVSPATIKADWAMARAWLACELAESPGQ